MDIGGRSPAIRRNNGLPHVGALLAARLASGRGMGPTAWIGPVAFLLPVCRAPLFDDWNSRDTPHLVTTGTYALVRHPTVAWYALLMFSLLLAFQAKPLLLALPLWIALDVLWVALQERLGLGKVLPGYEQYRQTTPMLIPNRRSVAVFLKGLHLPRALERSLQER